MAEPIGSLRAELSANAAAFHGDMMAARNSVRTATSSMKQSFTSLRTSAASAYKSIFSLRSVIAGGSAAALVTFVKRMANVADEIKSQSEAIGVTAEQYQEFIYMAEQMGASSEGAAKSLGIFTRVLGDAAQGSKSAVNALGAIGLTVADLAGKTPVEALSVVADRIRSIEDPTRRAAIAADLMGRGWQQLMPVLMQGGAAMDALRAKAHEMGLVVSNEMINKAAEANDKFDTLSQVLRVAGINAAAEFLPAISKIADIMTSAGFQQGVASFASETKDVISYISDNIETLKVWAAVMAGAYAGAKVGGFMGPAGRGIGAIIGGTEAYQQFGKGGAGADANSFGNLNKGVDNYLAKGAMSPFDISSGISRPGTGGDDDWSPLGKADDSDKWGKALQAIKDRTAALQLEASTYGQSTYEIERNKMALELRQEAEQNGVKLTDDTLLKINELSDAYAMQVQMLDQVRQAQERQQAAAQEAYSIVSQGFQDWIKGGKSFSEVLVDIAGKFADMAIQAAMAQLFAPATGGSAGGTFGTLFSMVGSLFGFATGGSFRIGGSGAPDSKLVSFMGSPGEIVDVRRPGQDNGGGAVIQQSYQFNNVDPTMRPWIQQQLARVKAESIAAANTSVRVGRANDPNYFPVG